MGAYFDLPHCVLRKFGYITSLWNFSSHSGLDRFRHDRSIVEMCCQLSSTKVDVQNVINWTVVGRARQALSTARFRRAGSLATAATCFSFSSHLLNEKIVICTREWVLLVDCISTCQLFVCLILSCRSPDYTGAGSRYLTAPI